MSPLTHASGPPLSHDPDGVVCSGRCRAEFLGALPPPLVPLVAPSLCPYRSRLPPNVSRHVALGALAPRSDSVSGHPLLTPMPAPFAFGCFPRCGYARAFPPYAQAALAAFSSGPQQRRLHRLFPPWARSAPPRRPSWPPRGSAPTTARARCPSNSLPQPPRSYVMVHKRGSLRWAACCLLCTMPRPTADSSRPHRVPSPPVAACPLPSVPYPTPQL